MQGTLHTDTTAKAGRRAPAPHDRSTGTLRAALCGHPAGPELLAALGALADRPLPATLVFDYPTVEAIAGFVAAEVLHLDRDAGPDTDADEPRESSDGALLNALLDDLNELSDEEIDRQLAERTRK